MRLDELDFDFREDLIAQHPSEPRDACRLLVADPRTGSISHHDFKHIVARARPGDVLVVNESKVFPARTWARKETGGRVELLFLRRLPDPVPTDGASDPAPPAGSSDADGADDTAEGGLPTETWEVLARPSARLRPGRNLTLDTGDTLELAALLGDGRWALKRRGNPGVLELLELCGTMPLPPYIHEPLRRAGDYQTVYAAATGSAAAPTAGLHFTTEVLGTLQAAGVDVERVTLHVGVDTFRPLTELRIEDHAIHSEWYRVEPDAVARIDRARAAGRRVIAVGTTAVRVLETLYEGSAPGGPSSGALEGSTRVYITPGYRFRAVDALITNFHLPRTSLLALVMAFGGVEFVRECYETAVREGYRFFSFGDAMFLEARAGEA
ncbi:MAG TPA: tRNA preQ1(34) S-adenosylmethionine ribosyltransferase-isomerase QueA [Thermoleophilia bacterium]|nr:tRNA preQ1(34) S-adenosylmethionine ribosyltransferase-isomerase QueA [Thermoleophilia bacterium]